METQLHWMPIWWTQTACGRAVWWNNKFYHTFPGPNRVIVRRAMDYITSKASCITFQEATEDTVDYVLIRDGADMCNSQLGRTGGKQVMTY